MTENLQDAWLNALLPHVAFDGWSERSIAAAAKDLARDAVEFQRAFPGGMGECVDYFSRRADARMVEALANYHLESMKIRERIAHAVMLRLEQALPEREAARKAMAFYLLPQHAARGLHALYRTVDEIWHAAGDTSTDFNFYTKRTLLAGVFASTLMVWLNDNSPGLSATREFLDRRIGNVMGIQKVRGKLAAFFKSA